MVHAGLTHPDDEPTAHNFLESEGTKAGAHHMSARQAERQKRRGENEFINAIWLN